MRDHLIIAVAHLGYGEIRRCQIAFQKILSHVQPALPALIAAGRFHKITKLPLIEFFFTPAQLLFLRDVDEDTVKKGFIVLHEQLSFD